MAVEQLTTAIEAVAHLNFLINATYTTAQDMRLTDETANEFAKFEVEIRLLHRGICILLLNILQHPDDYAHEGLRTSEESWENPPRTALAGLEEVRRVLNIVRHSLDSSNANVPLLGYDAVFDGQFADVLNHVQGIFGLLYAEIALDEDESDEDEEADPMADAEGVTYEEINALDEHIAGNEFGIECSICLDSIVAGQQIRELPCSHKFHKHCIDNWLLSSATCPMDRSNPFIATQ